HRQLVGILTQRKRQTALGIQVDEQYTLALLLHRSPQRRNRRRLGYPTLLIGDHKYPRHGAHPGTQTRIPKRPAAESVTVGLLQHRLFLLRHGETEWSKSGQHTGRTELDLTETGREQAKLAADALSVLTLDNPLVVSSPRRRARVTA